MWAIWGIGLQLSQMILMNMLQTLGHFLKHTIDAFSLYPHYILCSVHIILFMWKNIANSFIYCIVFKTSVGGCQRIERNAPQGDGTN